jgi:superfamily II DNA or RNA helicase
MVYTKSIRQCLNCENGENILDVMSRNKDEWKKGFDKYHSFSKNEIIQKLDEINAIENENDEVFSVEKTKGGKTDIRKGKSIDEYTIINIIKYLETDTGKTFKRADPETRKLFEYDPYETAYDKNKDKYRDYQRKIIESWTISSQELLILYYGVGTGKTLIATTMAEEFTRIMYDAYVYFILPASLVFNTIGLMFKYGIDPTIKDKEGNYIYNFLSYQQIVKTKYNFRPNSLLIIDEVHNLRTLITKPQLIKRGFKYIETGDYKIEGSILTEQLLFHSSQVKRKVFMTGTLFVNTPLDLEPIIAMGYNRPPLIEYRKDLYNKIMENDEEFKHYYQGLISFYRIEGENLKLMPSVKYNFTPIFTRDRVKVDLPDSDAFLLETRLLGTEDKIKWTIEFLKKNINKKTLIYAQFLDRQISLLIDEMKKDKSFRFGLISGQLSPKQKQTFIEAYNTNRINILIFSLAIKEGISFKETDNFIVFTPYWNYAITEQVIARAIRLDSHKQGSKSLVNVYFPFMNSLEEDLTKEEMDKAIIPFVKKAEDLMNKEGIKNFTFAPLGEDRSRNQADFYFNIPLDLKRQRDLDMYYRMFNKMSEINRFEKRLLKLPKFEDINNSENNQYLKVINKELLKKKKTIVKADILNLKKKIFKDVFEEDRKKLKRLSPQLTPEDYINRYFEVQDEIQSNLTDEEIDKIIEDFFDDFKPLADEKGEIIDIKSPPIDILLKRLGIDKEQIVKFQAFFTPVEICKKLIEYSGIENDPRGRNEDDDEDYLRILEGSAGIGNIVSVLIDSDEYLKDDVSWIIDANEYNKIFYKIGKYINSYLKRVNWTNLDFMTFVSHYNYDYIFGNPPFSLNTKKGIIHDIEFLAHAYDLLNENGTLAYIISNKFTFRSEKQFVQFRNTLEQLKSKNKNNVAIYDLKEGFKKEMYVSKNMETKVQMVYIIIKKVEGISFIFNQKEKVVEKKKKIIVELPPEPIAEEPIIPIKKPRGRPPKVKPEPAKPIIPEPIKTEFIKKICPDGKILNPKTNRCIKVKSIDKKPPKPIQEPIKTEPIKKPRGRPPKVKPEPAKPIIPEPIKTEPIKKICPDGKILNPKTNRCIKVKSIDNKKPLVKTNIEKELIKKIGKTIPNDLIYDINEDIDFLKKIKNKKQKEKDIKDILNELNESDKIAKEILNETKSKIKKDKVLLFIEYNNKRIQLINEVIK